MNLAIQRRESVDVLRLGRFKAGETVEEIAESEGVTPGTVLAGVQRAQKRKEMFLLFELVDMKLQGALDNERIRHRIRSELSEKLVSALELLLSGKRTIIISNPITGEIVAEEIIDPEVIAIGIEQVIKIISIEQRPEQPMQTS